MFRHSAQALDICGTLEDVVLFSRRNCNESRDPATIFLDLSLCAEAGVAVADCGEVRESLLECFLLLVEASNKIGFKMGDLFSACEVRQRIKENGNPSTGGNVWVNTTTQVSSTLWRVKSTHTLSGISVYGHGETEEAALEDYRSKSTNPLLLQILGSYGN